ncbi:MAG: InlB B-repeat-containing protein, partial [Lachnospiraceae bacterium]|nr:InlB B-repeat-containing protein [Lachnospiraceae bacterium]
SKESDYASRPKEITKDLYQVKEYYSMTFDFKGHGYSDSPMYGPWRYEPGEKPYKPLEPKEEGWIFKGWYTSATDHSDAAKFDFSQPLTGSVAVYAWWVKEHTVTFHLNNGSSDDVFKVILVENGSYVAAPEEIPQRKDYEFQVWSFNPEAREGLSRKTITKDTDVYALWKDVSTKSVFFDLNGKTVSEEPGMLHVVAGNKVKEPKKPQATEGWEFLGWYKDSGCTDGNEFDFENELITEDTILHAKWSDKLKLWVDGTQVDASNCDNEAFSYDIARHELTLKDLTFSKTNEEIPSETIPVTALKKPYVAYIYADGMDITIKGKARMSGEELINVAGILVGGSVTLDGDFEICDTGAAIYARNVIINGGSIKADSKAIGDDDKYGNTKMPYGIWAASSIEFNGGTTDIDLIDAVDGYALAVRAGDISINDGEVHLKVQEYTDAKLIKNHGKVNNSLNILGPAGVAFDAGRQCFVDAYGEEAVEVRLGKGENPWCIVRFSVNGISASAPVSQSVKRGTKAKVPVAPYAAGFEFCGWYTAATCKDEERFNFDTPVTEDITLYAKWEKSSETDPAEHPEILVGSQSPLDPVPVIGPMTTDLYLVKGQKFIIPDCWVIKRDDKDSKKIISISKKGQFKAKKTGEAKIWYGDRVVNVHVMQPAVTKSLKLEAGQTENRQISVSGIDPVAMPVFFYSANPEVARVDQYGNVYAYAKGSVVITAYINGSAYKCKVTVTENNGTTRERSMYMVSGSTRPIRVKVKGVKKLEWTSSDPEVAELNDAKTKVTTKKPGMAVLTAKAGSDPMDTYSIYVFSEDNGLYGNYLEGRNNKYSMKMNTGEKKQSVLEMNYLQHSVLFKSSKPDIAFLDEYGNVVARRKGKAKFSAKVNGKTITINVTVE